VAKTLLEMAKDFAQSFVEAGQLSAEDMQNTLQKTYTTLTALKAQEESGTISAVSVPQTLPVDWRKSITKHAVTCLECRHAFKQLSSRHLRKHGLDSRLYRTKYGIPSTQPLAARATTIRRRQIVQETRPWEKSPRYRSAKMQDGAAPEPNAEALPEKSEELSAVAAPPAQPKRQRKTSPKKTARKTRSEG
jgi:predicted transcriptional regulator